MRFGTAASAARSATAHVFTVDFENGTVVRYGESKAVRARGDADPSCCLSTVNTHPSLDVRPISTPCGRKNYSLASRMMKRSKSYGP
jgi:hypothetical protein